MFFSSPNARENGGGFKARMENNSNTNRILVERQSEIVILENRDAI
jgi:hypothetical protein